MQRRLRRRPRRAHRLDAHRPDTRALARATRERTQLALRAAPVGAVGVRASKGENGEAGSGKASREERGSG